MRELVRTALVPLSAAKLYALITDIERYPQFVPGCTHARIESQQGNEVVATLGVRRGALDAQFTTRNTLEPDRAVTMRLLRGPFKTLEGLWSVTPRGEHGCEVGLRLRFEFANRLAGAMLTPMFEDTAKSLVDAFVARARELARDTPRDTPRDDGSSADRA